MPRSLFVSVVVVLFLCISPSAMAIAGRYPEAAKGVLVSLLTKGEKPQSPFLGTKSREWGTSGVDGYARPFLGLLMA